MPEADIPAEPFVVAIFGPTGIGKTGVAIELGELIQAKGGRAVAVNCDSMQVYSGLETITGAPTATERGRLEHLLVSCVPIDETYSSAAYAREAHEAIDRVLKEGAWPLVVGGTGLYLRAALSELELRPTIPDVVKEELDRDWEREGGEAMHRRLSDGLRASVHPNDRKRILRYLGLERIGESPHPDTAGGGALWSSGLRHPTLLVGLTEDRERLVERIEARVRKMAEAGAIEEARAARDASVSATASRAIGFEEFLNGDVQGVSRKQAALVRRQMTWMNRMEGVTRIERQQRSDREIAGEILAMIEAGKKVNASGRRPG